MATLDVNYRDGHDERLSWVYPDYYNTNPTNFYALAKYTENVATSTSERQTIYAIAKKTLAGSNCPGSDCVKVQSRATDDYLLTHLYQLNAYITGLQGFIKLQDLSGNATVDAALRTRVNTELTRLITLKFANFSVDTSWTNFQNGYEYNMVNLSRNFLWMTPDLAALMKQNAGVLTKVQQAVAEYNTVGPYWFVSRFDAATAESANQNLYDYPSLFQAKAYILGASREDLSKWLDAPAFYLGDYFYLQNLVATLQAPFAAATPTPGPSTPTPSPVPGDANGDGHVDGIDYVIWLNHYQNSTTLGPSSGDFNSDGTIDGIDYVIWLNNYGK